MRKILFSLFFVAVALTGFAQESHDHNHGGGDVKKVVEAPIETAPAEDNLGIKETSFDFGRIPQGRPVTHIFEAVNNGKSSLNISNIQASCGCTTPEWERNKIQAPGEKTNITVGYNAASEGSFTKTITISYNGSLSKQITIKGEVWKTPLSSAPENKELKNLKDDIQ